MDEARRHILQLVQDGHMNPDQAATILEMMDRGRMQGPFPTPPPQGGWGWPGMPQAPAYGPPPGPHAPPPPPPGHPGGPPPMPHGGPPPPGPHAPPPPPPGPYGGPPPPGPPPPGPYGAPPPPGPPYGPHPGGPPPPWPPPPWPPGPPDPHHIAALVRDLGPQRARRVARAIAHGGQVVVSVASGGGETQRTRSEGRAELGSAREVMVDQAYGDVDVSIHEQEEVSWTLECETAGAAQPATVECEARSERLVLRVRVPSMPEGSSSRASLAVRVPRHLHVRCESANGEVRVTGLQARVRVRSGNGPVQLTDHEGAFEVAALNGPVSMRAVHGDGELRIENGRLDVEGAVGRWGVRIANGEVHVARGQGRLRLDGEHANVSIDGFEGELRLETGIGNTALRDVGPDVIARSTRTGSIEARTGLPPGARLELRAGTGDVRLHLTGEPNVRLALQTSSGRIDCGLPLEQVERTAHALTGNAGAPHAQAALETVLGSVRVDLAAD